MSRTQLFKGIFVLAVFLVVVGFSKTGQTSLSIQKDAVLTKEPAGPSLTTYTWAIFNPKTGEILDGEYTNTKKPIASITKLFTAVAVLKSKDKDKDFTIIQSDIDTEGVSGRIHKGESFSMYKLLFPLLLESSNDAAHAIQRYLDKEYFETLETVFASLSISDTSLSDASGLDARNVSTAEDLAIFFSYIKRSHPHILDITRLNKYVGEFTGYSNNNRIHTFNGYYGGKQGFTDEAGKTFIGSFVTQNNSNQIGVIVLGSTDLLVDVQNLIEYARNTVAASDIMSQ